MNENLEYEWFSMLTEVQKRTYFQFDPDKRLMYLARETYLHMQALIGQALRQKDTEQKASVRTLDKIKAEAAAGQMGPLRAAPSRSEHHPIMAMPGPPRVPDTIFDPRSEIGRGLTGAALQQAQHSQAGQQGAAVAPGWEKKRIRMLEEQVRILRGAWPEDLVPYTALDETQEERYFGMNILDRHEFLRS